MKAIIDLLVHTLEVHLRFCGVEPEQALSFFVESDARGGRVAMLYYLLYPLREYIFGFQNSAEQRGTGGAMLRFARLSIAQGKPNFDTKTSTVYDVDRERQVVECVARGYLTGSGLLDYRSTLVAAY